MKSDEGGLQSEDCKTSDITKVSHVRDVGAIVHERFITQRSDPSKNIEIRSELESLSHDDLS